MNELYEKYASLLLKKCLNITTQKSLIINAPIENIEFVRILARQAYRLGIEDIYFDLEDEDLKNDQLENLSKEALSESRFWNKAIYDEYAKKDAAFLMLISGNGKEPKSIDPEKIAHISTIYRSSRPLYKKRQRLYEVPWCFASTATKNWAQKMFPNDENPVQKLWNLIFKCCLIDQEDPEKAWEEKIEQNNKKSTVLNKYQFQELHYQNKKGTDLIIGLPENHIWCNVGEKGIVNMPSEEVFTSPDRMRVNGIVYSSKPLDYNGGIIDEFSICFKDGKITQVDAKQGLELLKQMVTSCPNADRLGEVALVDYDSPISQTSQIFYNTLFDENASCHLAIGSSFPKCTENGENLTSEELEEKGLNQSDTHIDFMIGTSDLTITGTTKDKRKIKIFENGNFILK